MPDMQTPTVEHFDAEIKKCEGVHLLNVNRLKEAEKLQTKVNEAVAAARLDVDIVASRLDSLRASRYLLICETRRTGPVRPVPQELADRARRAGLIQAEIAKRMGMGLPRYKSIISGTINLPSGFLCQLTQVIEAAEAQKEAHVG